MFIDNNSLRSLCVFGVEATNEERRFVGYSADGSTFEVRKLPPWVTESNKQKYFRHGGTITGVDWQGKTFVAPYSKHIEDLLKEQGFTEAAEMPSILGNSSMPQIVGTRRWINDEMKTGRKYYEGQIYHLNNDKVSEYDPARYDRLKALETHPVGSEEGMAWNNISFLARLEAVVGYEDLKKIGIDMGINIDDFYNSKVIDNPSHPEKGYYFVTSLEANEILVKLAERVKMSNYVINAYDVSKMPTTLHRLGREFNAVDVVINEQNSRYKKVMDLTYEATSLIRELEYITEHPTKENAERLAEIQKKIRNEGIDLLAAMAEELKKECDKGENRNKGDEYASVMADNILPRAQALTDRLKVVLDKAKEAVAKAQENTEQPGGPQ